MKKKSKVLVIDTSKWLRGEGGDTSSLFSPISKKKCCLGFLGTFCGYTDQELKARPSPANTIIAYNKFKHKWPEWLIMSNNKDSEIGQWLMAINDHKGKEDEDILGIKALNKLEGKKLDMMRRKLIREEFKRQGITVKFVDGSV